MRVENTKKNLAYLMSQDEILRVAQAIKDNNIRVVFLQGGENPQTTLLVGESIPIIKKMFHQNVEILLCLGNKTKEEYAYLKKQGADSYIIKHETSDSVLHERMRHQTLQSRLDCLQTLLELGYNVGTGSIIGLPYQSLESIANDILLAQHFGVHMMSASPFVPAQDTPLQEEGFGDLDTTLNTIAVSRIINPKWLIPSVSALEKIKPGGQLQGLNAGANVITINFTPREKVSSYLIYGKDRYMVKTDHVNHLLKRAGLISDTNINV